jgi:hypothetical protein
MSLSGVIRAAMYERLKDLVPEDMWELQKQ